MITSLRARIESAIGFGVLDITPLSGGCVGEVYQVHLPGNEAIVAKIDDRPAPRLSLEGYMLRLYPLLVHVHLFGGSYVHSVATILRRFGF
jgi:fructosamine-3-kinase